MNGVGSRLRSRNVVGRDDFSIRHGLHLKGKGVPGIGCEFVRVVDEGTGTVNYLS